MSAFLTDYNYGENPGQGIAYLPETIDYAQGTLSYSDVGAPTGSVTLTDYIGTVITVAYDSATQSVADVAGAISAAVSASGTFRYSSEVNGSNNVVLTAKDSVGAAVNGITLEGDATPFTLTGPASQGVTSTWSPLNKSRKIYVNASDINVLGHGSLIPLPPAANIAGTQAEGLADAIVSTGAEKGIGFSFKNIKTGGGLTDLVVFATKISASKLSETLGDTLSFRFDGQFLYVGQLLSRTAADGYVLTNETAIDLGVTLPENNHLALVISESGVGEFVISQHEDQLGELGDVVGNATFAPSTALTSAGFADGAEYVFQIAGLETSNSVIEQFQVFNDTIV